MERSPSAAVFLVLYMCIATGASQLQPKFSKTPTWPHSNYYDEDGPPILLDCPLVSYDGVKLLWFKDEQRLNSVPNVYVFGDGNSTLTLTLPKHIQTGHYRCSAFNTAGNISHGGEILIAARTQETKPRVVQLKPNTSIVYANIGDVINISCTFDVGGSSSALMDLSLEWLKDGETVNDTIHTTWGVDTTDDNSQVFALHLDSVKALDYGTYTCFGINSRGNDSKSISVTTPKPVLKHIPVNEIIIGSSLGVVAVLVGVVAFVVLRHKKKQQEYDEMDWPDPDIKYDVPERKIEYDVFISYSSDDLKWTKDVLFSKLDAMGYNVCIDFKDFMPGLPIAENIMDSIYKSKKTIVLMSGNFLKSMWGQFELQQVHQRAVLQRKDVLIVIKYDQSKVPLKLTGKTFLDWNDNKVKPHFWARLFDAIGKPGDLQSDVELNNRHRLSSDDFDTTNTDDEDAKLIINV
ncbi:interleukin-1 receptor accessory protein-like [Mya arenaria]|uniref:interleukin-1 receptor accessory protein-like n=1 Tax=Mya arenaria TaxID=6604 RepID=UPI0022E08B2C|nr:interleukin-1 receptor accessory protein-like [Mya arenaria]XP_052813821.1 interleukin-1 receptor accessory protein-like [Mya arenaria]